MRKTAESTLEYAVVSKPWTPHGYQKRTMKFMLERACAALLLDPGMGKTSCVYGAVKVLMKRGLSTKTLVIAPLRPCWLVWPAEQEKWTDFKGLRVEVLHGPHKDEALARDADIYVINPEGLEWLFGCSIVRAPYINKDGVEKVHVKIKWDFKRFKKFGFDTLVIDELTMFKHPKSLRFRILKPMLRFFARRWGLTGTFAPNGLVDLFGQCYVLDMGNALGPFITHFQNQFFDKSFDGFSFVLREGAEEKIYERVRPLALRMEARDYLELPEEVPSTIWIDLPPKIRTMYDELEKSFITMLDDGSYVTAANAAAKATKLRQIACGGIYKKFDSDGMPLQVTEAVNLHSEKTNALRELVDGCNGKPVLVAYEFHHDLDRLLKEFGKNMPVIGAGVSMARCKEIEREWNLGRLGMLLGQPAAMGHGLNLQVACDRVVWHSLTWNLELFDQYNDRVLRQGNTSKRVFVDRIVARNTVEEAVILSLSGKDRTQQALLKALKTYAEQRRSVLGINKKKH